MIVGIGVDVVNTVKFAATLRGTPSFADALFTVRELVDEEGAPRSSDALAARYAAKLALSKALGRPGALRWHDVEVLGSSDTGYQVLTHGDVRQLSDELGVQTCFLSLATEGDVAVGYVVAEGEVAKPRLNVA